MSLRLSLLDKCPVQPHESAPEALTRAVTMAKTAEQSGFHRYWLAEHHGVKALASSVPEILIAHILAHTSRIRVGSGGVMLQHYSPYKVAETFHMLASLAPGRVDLGVGKAPGGFPYTTRALQSAIDPQRRGSFADQLRQLDAFLARADRESNKKDIAVATPLPDVPPERFLLGGSVESAELAAELDWTLVFAGQFHGDTALMTRCFDIIARRNRQKPMICVTAFAAESEAQARRTVENMRVYKMHIPGAQSINLVHPDHAVEFARQAGITEYRLEESKPSILAGTPEQVCAALLDLQRRFGVDEIIIETPTTSPAERLQSVKLIGHAVLSSAAASS